MKKVVIIIPVHSSSPSGYELISFMQCFKILGNHPIKVLAPEKLNLNKYREVVNDFEVVYINPKWQSTILQYNKLKLSWFFYNLFKEYKFLMTYELDAFVFKDELAEWCAKGYDYIGAPWFQNYNSAKSDKLIGAGNSGFSLRKIQTIIKGIKQVYYWNAQDFEAGRIQKLRAYLKWPYNVICNFFCKENFTIQNASFVLEDRFISDVIANKVKDFKLAPVSEACKFSFEVNPKYLFALNHQQLPMGCHAWWKYDFNFWKPYILNYGYKL